MSDISKILEIFLPLFSSLPENNISLLGGGAQSLLTVYQQRKTKLLEDRLFSELERINISLGELSFNQDYLLSDEFITNVIQAYEAAQNAENQNKINYIASALANCTIITNNLNINRSICMRIIKQITYDELNYLIDIIKSGRFPSKQVPGPHGLLEYMHFVETEENTLMVRGLVQLGLLIPITGFDSSIHLRTSILAEHIVSLCTHENLNNFE